MEMEVHVGYSSTFTCPFSLVHLKGKGNQSFYAWPVLANKSFPAQVCLSIKQLPFPPTNCTNMHSAPFRNSCLCRRARQTYTSHLHSHHHLLFHSSIARTHQLCLFHLLSKSLALVEGGEAACKQYRSLLFYHLAYYILCCLVRTCISNCTFKVHQRKADGCNWLNTSIHGIASIAFGRKLQSSGEIQEQEPAFNSSAHQLTSFGSYHQCTFVPQKGRKNVQLRLERAAHS